MIELDTDCALEPASEEPHDPRLGRRIEDWIVSAIDDRAATGRNDRSGIVAAVRQQEGGSAMISGGWARFRLSRHRGVALATLTDPALIREADLVELVGDLVALAEAGTRRLVIDFEGVERISTWAADALASAVGRCLALEPGSIKLAGVRDELAPVLGLVGLDRVAPVCPDAVSAIVGPWLDRDDLRPLPVSILAALLAPANHPNRPSTDGESELPPAAEGGPAAMHRIRLIVQDGPSMGRAVEMKGERFVVGRCPGCDLQVASAVVSRSHAAIARRGDRLFLRDLASTNGTTLNGQALRLGEAEVRDGDLIRVGPIELALAIDEVAAGLASKVAPRSLTIGGDRLAAGDDTIDLAIEADLIGFRFEVIDEVSVLTPLDPDLGDDGAVGRLRDALTGLFDRAAPRRVVLNLEHVGHLSSRGIGVLVAHQIRLDRSGGALRVCLANPRVGVVLDQVRLSMLVDCHQTVEDAVIMAWPHLKTGLSSQV